VRTDPKDPKAWAARIVLFACWPLVAVFLAVAVTVMLVLAWPVCLFLHRLSPKERR